MKGLKNKKNDELYNRLGISRNADSITIKKAYHKMAMETHPDYNDSPDAAEEFQKVFEAYKILKDPYTKRIYDEAGVWEKLENQKVEEEKITQAAGQLIATELASIIASQGENMLRYPIIQIIEDTVKRRIGEGNNFIRKTKREIAFLEKLIKRLKYKGEGIDILEATLIKGIEKFESEIHDREENTKILNRASDILKYYEFQMDPLDDNQDTSPLAKLLDTPFFKRSFKNVT